MIPAGRPPSSTIRREVMAWCSISSSALVASSSAPIVFGWGVITSRSPRPVVLRLGCHPPPPPPIEEPAVLLEVAPEVAVGDDPGQNARAIHHARGAEPLPGHLENDLLHEGD